MTDTQNRNMIFETQDTYAQYSAFGDLPACSQLLSFASCKFQIVGEFSISNNQKLKHTSQAIDKLEDLK